MTAGRDENELISEYLAEKLTAWLDRTKGRTLDAAAKIAGVSKTQLSNLKNGTRGAGMDTIVGLARVFGLTLAEVQAEALRRGSTRAPKTKDQTKRTVVLDPRYPALAEAIELRADVWLPKTQETMASQASHALFDLTVGQWIDQGDRVDAQNRKALPHGRPLDVEDDTPPAGR